VWGREKPREPRIISYSKYRILGQSDNCVQG
jgi:hypothetical protein